MTYYAVSLLTLQKLGQHAEAGLKHSGVLTQCQRGKTSAMTLEKQLLLPINLGRVIRPFPDYLESIILQRERLFTSGKHRQLSVLPCLDVPASSLRGQTAMLRVAALVAKAATKKNKSCNSDSPGIS